VSPAEVHQASQQYFVRIHRAALILTGNPWDADDLAQETFLVLARQSNGFAGRSTLYTWLYGVLLNLERRERRRHGMRRRKLRVLWDDRPADPRTAPAADTSLEVAEWKQGLWGQVAKLPDPQRHALVLRFGQRLSYEEIAQALACPLGTAKSRIFNGLAALRELMDRQQQDWISIPAHPAEDLNHAL
jgi:RNA polymerase sigma-70 factor (ECF subfamily)